MTRRALVAVPAVAASASLGLFTLLVAARAFTLGDGLATGMTFAFVSFAFFAVTFLIVTGGSPHATRQRLDARVKRRRAASANSQQARPREEKAG